MAAENNAKIGFVGLGHMGGNMAARFLAAGYTVYGEDRSREHTQQLIEQGLRWCDTARDVAQAANVVFTSLPNDDVLEQVASAPDGIVAGLRTGKASSSSLRSTSASRCRCSRSRKGWRSPTATASTAAPRSR